MTQPEHWLAAKRLFDAALDLPPDRREAFLQREAATAPAAAAEARSLLDWHDSSTEFLEKPAAGHLGDLTPADSEPAPLVGQSLGPWRIVGVVGRGGMGTVYRAERADEAFDRQVAIKVVKPGVESAPIVERFRRERETLAALDHPRIARLMDGGTTADGQPYFVMELVDGVPIDRYCDEHRLTIQQRLDLFRAVCGGVQYAHENLIVHRDIKPDNILVARDGRPKLLDFGVSKILSMGAASGTDAPAVAATWMMTPDYASPEQIAGRAITTASDVYSLGVLLHVLLTGARPYRLTGSTPEMIQEQLDVATLTPPSVRAANGADAVERAALRGTTPSQLARRLRGDLDAIVGRALGRDVSERYSSVEQLVNDLERHRLRLPVVARGQDRMYLARTFVRRNRVALAVAAGAVVLSAIGVGGVLWQASIAADERARAERRFEDVRRLAQTFQSEVHDAMVTVPGTTAARAILVRTTLEYLESLAKEAAGDLSLQRELAAAFVRVGDAQGNPSGPNLGDTAGALTSYRRAIAVAEGIAGGPADDLETARTLGLAHRRLGDALAWSGDTQTAVRHGETSERLFAGIAARADAGVEDRLQAIIGRIKLGDTVGNPNFPNLGRNDDAAQHYEVALAALRQLDAGAPDNARVRRYLGLTLERIGTLHEHARRWPEATNAYQESFLIRKALAEAQPAPIDVQRDLAIAYEKLGNIRYYSGNAAAAAAEYRNALAQFERLGKADPTDVNAARTVAISREKLAGVLADLGDHAEARNLFRMALVTHRQLAERDPESAQARCDLSRVAELQGDQSQRQARVVSAAASPAACSSWRESLTTRQALRASGREACATTADLSRLAAKLQACR